MATSFSILRFSHPRLLLLPLFMLSLQLYSVLSDARPPRCDCSKDVPICWPFDSADGPPGYGTKVISCDQGITRISLFNQTFRVRNISYSERKIDIVFNPASFIQEQLCSRDPQEFELERKTFFPRGFNFSTLPIVIWKCNDTLKDRGKLKEYSCGKHPPLYFGPPSDCEPPHPYNTTCSRCEIPGTSISDDTNNSETQTFSLQWDFDCDSGGSNPPEFPCEGGPMKPSHCEGEQKNHKNVHWAIILGAVLFFIIFVTCFILFFYFRNRTCKRKPHVVALFYTSSTSSSRTSSQPNLESTSFYLRCRNVSIFSFEELEKATDGFSPSNELGDGGFGVVYFGVLSDGRKVAIKRLFEHSFNRVEQFMNEVEILSNIQHANLVRLHGCTTRNSRELLLVYEYVDNGTVGDHLNGSRAVDGCLTWKLRLNIAVKTAEALAYLHQLKPPIIHRDVKTSNILLDENFHVKVSDFGLSRLFPFNVSHVSTVPQGTPGYIDPQYHQCYQLTDKSDVYSFGVVLMELISSLPAVDIMRPRDEVNLANMALNMIRNNALNEFVDASLGFQSDYLVQKSVGAVAELAFSCLAYEMEVRPSMDEVAETLRQIQAQVQKSEKNIPTFQALLKSTMFLKARAHSSPNPLDDKQVKQSTIPNSIV